MKARENQQFSTESSGTSMTSSSRSSSMSSLEFNRTIQIEPPPINQMKIPENSNSGAAMKQGSQGHQPLDFYDIVKESMHRDVHGLSVKTVAKEEKKGRILKYIDSPRPLEPSKFVNTGVMVAWDSPRLSYDGRDTQDTFKSATKPKELPRLSLDSRQGSIKSFNEGTKSRSLLKGPQKGYGSSSTMQLQEPETSRRPSSVVAKLMGLEAFPDCTETCDTPPRISHPNPIESNPLTYLSLINFFLLLVLILYNYSIKNNLVYNFLSYYSKLKYFTIHNNLLKIPKRLPLNLREDVFSLKLEKFPITPVISRLSCYV